MILGIGIDIVENNRIEKLYFNFKNKFLNKVFTKKEIDDIIYLKNPTLRMANRFAAKEAFYKAISSKIKKPIFFWKDVEIINSVSGSPKIVLYGMSKECLDDITPKNCNTAIHISLSHEKNNTVAMVIIELNKLLI